MIPGSELRRARARLGLSQKEMAERLHVSQRAYGDWERNAVPSVRTIHVTELLGTTVVTRPGIETFSDQELITEITIRLLAKRRAEAEATVSADGLLSEATSGNIGESLGGEPRQYVFGRGPGDDPIDENDIAEA